MSGNWMWAAKAEGEGAKMVDAVDSLCQVYKFWLTWKPRDITGHSAK